MFVLEGGSRFIVPRTEMTYPGHNVRLHQNAADPEKSPVDHVMADLEDACPYEFKGPKSRAVMVGALSQLDFGHKVVSGLRAKTVGAANLGMDGTWVIHPRQAKICNECYTPNDEQVAHAGRVSELSHEKGGGSMADPETGEMIDEAAIKIALMDLAKAVQAGAVSAEYLARPAKKSHDITGYDILDQMRRVG